MAEIKPIRAWRYNPAFTAEIESLTSPLFDVVSDKQRAALYKNPFNSIHLSLPGGPQAADRATLLLRKWKDERVLVQDRLPGIYVYYQYFKMAGNGKEYCRKGFICHIKATDWKEKIILRHENTIPSAVNDRIELLEKTQLQVSPTHGLYSDPEMVLEGLMDQAIENPIYETEDYQGVRDVLAVIHDASVIEKFISHFSHLQIILADGHHRYESSLVYRHKRLASDLHPTGYEGYNYHLIYLSNTERDDLRILPTHRLITGIENFDEGTVLRKLENDFNIKAIEDPDTINEVIIGKPWAFGLLFKENAYKVKLKPEVIKNNPWPFPDEIKSLDLTVMHYFIIEKALGIAGKDQRKSPHISFDRSFGDCLAKVLRSEAQMAIITQEVSMEDVKRVCRSGYTMPQKSTYFYPKVICGFLFSSIREDEFAFPDYVSF